MTTSLRVLVVDDDRDNADSMALLVRAWGHEVRATCSGADALAAVPEYRPDAMIVDIGIPKMDGNELARQVRQLPPQEDTLLIALTGYGYEKDHRLSKEAGFNHHLLKPVDPGILEILLSAGHPARVPDR